jgi:peroxiredoxin
MTRWPDEVPISTGAEGAVVMVGHSDCETSRLMLRALERFHRRRTRDVAVSALLQDEPEAARALAAKLGLSLPLILDRDPYPMTSRLGVQAVPVTFVLAADGGVRESLVAFRRADVERLASSLLGLASQVFEPEEGVTAYKPG